VIVPTILCGGAGTRLWPASRPHAPKPFLPLVDGVSTFELTLERIADAAVFAPPLIVASASHAHLVDAALAERDATATVLLEPASRDTAAAIAAAAHLAARDADAVMLVLPADHVIRNNRAFVELVSAVASTAEAGRIVTFGVRPDRPATEYGYIQPGALIGSNGARNVDRFIEKPDAAQAAKLVSAGCLWNSGMFLMRAATALAELERHVPMVASAARDAVRGAVVDGAYVLLAAEPFTAAPRISFDYAVMEKTTAAAVVAADFDWSDLGTWAAVWDAGHKDADGNLISGDAVVIDSRDSYISTSRPKVGVVGVDDVVVVATDDAVLVAGRSRADAVKRLVKAIEAAPEANLGDFIRHYRPWGHYQSLDLGTRHQVKRIVVDPGKRLSLQKHAHRSEHWTVVEGVAEVTVGTAPASVVTRTVPANESVHIPKGAVHRLANRGSAPVVVIEVQFGDYLGEDDIVRLEDDYGRGNA
jgi:mannose-1-phosphate guanylyltransferase/mannose-6-phosphate isomerase